MKFIMQDQHHVEFGMDEPEIVIRDNKHPNRNYTFRLTGGQVKISPTDTERDK